RQLDGNLAVDVLEQGNRQFQRQVHGIRAVDLFTQLQLLDHHLVLGFELTLGDQVMQVQVQSAFANAIARELAGVGRQCGQLDTLETGRDVQTGEGVERVE
nr:hypothetical protein [Tanacetum cinerariifolium]